MDIKVLGIDLGKTVRSLAGLELAEEVGFEPTDACTSPVFKTGAFDHSATPPGLAGAHKRQPGGKGNTRHAVFCPHPTSRVPMRPAAMYCDVREQFSRRNRRR